LKPSILRVRMASQNPYSFLHEYVFFYFRINDAYPLLLLSWLINFCFSLPFACYQYTFPCASLLSPKMAPSLLSWSQPINCYFKIIFEFAVAVAVASLLSCCLAMTVASTPWLIVAFLLSVDSCLLLISTTANLLAPKLLCKQVDCYLIGLSHPFMLQWLSWHASTAISCTTTQQQTAAWLLSSILPIDFLSKSPFHCCCCLAAQQQLFSMHHLLTAIDSWLTVVRSNIVSPSHHFISVITCNAQQLLPMLLPLHCCCYCFCPAIVQ